jgi:hypothetical protein
MSNDVRDTSVTQLMSFNFANFVFSLLSRYSVNDETTFGVVEDSEMFVGFLDGDDIWS